MSRLGTLGHQLYAGEVSYDIVGKRRRWYILSAVLVLIAVASILVRGLNLGIEFTGGAEFQVPAQNCSIEQARAAVESTGETVSTATQLGNDSIRITTEAVDNATSLEIREVLAQACGVGPEQVSVQIVGPTWGGEITQKALTALGVFLGLLAVFLAIYFNWRMAVAALVAVVHDIVLTVGVYSLLQFEVTPSTVIGVLTILGYSLYDTVVVFDKVKENTRGITSQSRQTYSQAANLAVNQTLVRSINTTIVALMPVGAILFVGAGLLGAGTLKDLALALFVGMAAGAYSSVFIATPLLAQMMEKDPQMKALAGRVQARGASGRAAAPAAAAAAAGKSKGRSAVAVAEPEALAGELAEEAGSTEGEGDAEAEALARARARRAAAAGANRSKGAGPRNQPKRNSRSKR